MLVPVWIHKNVVIENFDTVIKIGILIEKWRSFQNDPSFILFVMDIIPERGVINSSMDVVMINIWANFPAVIHSWPKTSPNNDGPNNLINRKGGIEQRDSNSVIFSTKLIILLGSECLYSDAFWT